MNSHWHRIRKKLNSNITEPVSNSELCQEEIDVSTLNKDNYFGVILDASKISKSEFQSIYDGKMPVILRNVFNNINSENWTKNLINQLFNEVIYYDSQDNTLGNVDTYECPLQEYLSIIQNYSDHSNSLYMMDENLLQKFNESETWKLNKNLFEENLFDIFPKSIRPNAALIIGGEGSRSFLHIDPFEWTGWNYLLEGRKLWTFIPYDSNILDLLGSKRNAPDAWSGIISNDSNLIKKDYKISAGWVSDVDLYNVKLENSLHNLVLKFSRKIMPSIQSNSSFKKLLNLAIEYDNSLPSKQKILSTSLNNHWITGLKEQDSTNDKHPNYYTIPIFTSNDNNVNFCDKNNSISSGSIQIIQEEGDLILIPPKMWHQVYHLQPSIAIASQYINSCNKVIVYQHILDWCKEEGKKLFVQLPIQLLAQDYVVLHYKTNDFYKLNSSEFQLLDVQEQIMSVIYSGLCLKYGIEEGNSLFQKLI
eukprot:gene11706-15671_t